MYCKLRDPAEPAFYLITSKLCLVIIYKVCAVIE
jgi:hypothetical protein